MSIKTISMNAKCNDMCFMVAVDKEGNRVGNEHDGYVPDFMPGTHYGDYIELEIDIETGMILNWKKPTQAELNKTFKKKEDEK